MSLAVYFVGLAVFCALAWIWLTKHPKGFPPGPRAALPIVGDSWAMGSDLTGAFEELTKKYGPMVGFYLGPMRSVVISDPYLITEAMSHEDLAHKPPSHALTKARGGLSMDGAMPGVLNNNGVSWQEQRRFTLKTLRDLGLGKHGIESLVAEEVQDMCSRLESEGGRHVQVRGYFNRSALRALWMVMTGDDFEVSKSDLPRTWKKLEGAHAGINVPIIQILQKNYPFFTSLMHWAGIDTVVDCFIDFHKVVTDIVKQHEDTFQADEPPRDFTDAYIAHRYLHSLDPDSSFFGEEGKKNIVSVLSDIMLAGTDTTSNSLSWAVLFMAKNPEVLKKVQQELDATVGRGRLPCWDDRKSTPYTEATVHELQRMANMVPNGLPHYAVKDVRIGKHVIPKGTQVFPFYGHVMTSEKHFPEPEAFKPERYLTKEGAFEPHPLVIPFGVGRRRCLGEGLARMELYRFFAAIVHRFDVVPAPGDPLSTDGTLGNMNIPPPFKVSFISRDT